MSAKPGGWKLLTITLGGSGLIPFAPGTFGSLAATLLLLVISRAWHPEPVAWNAILAIQLFIYSFACVALGRWTADYFARKDPGPCVVDEGAGICLTALFVPIHTGWRGVAALVVIFATFRLFDITKLPPARQLEKWPHGWGILMDDLAAAVYANIASQLIVRLLII